MSQNVIFPNTKIIKQSALLEVLNTRQKVLFIGQKTAAGSATGGQLYSEIGNDNHWDVLFGARSILAGMLRAAREENGVTRFDAIPLNDAGTAVNATCVVDFGVGPATAATTIKVYVGSKSNHAYTISVSNTDTIIDIGDALAAAITADVKAPFTALNAAGVVTITAANGGTEANQFLIKYEGEIEGVTITLTGWTGGTTDPVLTNIFDIIGEERYQTIVWPGAYPTAELEGLLDPRWNADDYILDGVGILYINDSLINIKTKANALNSQSIAILAGKTETLTDYIGGSVPELNYMISAKVAAIRALRLTLDANISNYIISTAANDQIGGPSLSTLPYANTPIISISTIETGKGWKAIEIGEINDAGASIVGNNRNNTNIIVGEMVTTYKTDPAANPDITYKYLNYVDTASNVAEYFYNNSIRDFGQTRLTEGSLRQGFSMNNKKSITATLTAYYRALTGDVYLLLQDGEAALNFFKQNLVVNVDILNRKCTIQCKVPIITQLGALIITIQYAFNTN